MRLIFERFDVRSSAIYAAAATLCFALLGTNFNETYALIVVLKIAFFFLLTFALSAVLSAQRRAHDIRLNPLAKTQATQNLFERQPHDLQLRFVASLQQNLTDAVIATDMEFHIQSWNHGAEVIYGWQPEEVMGKKVSEVLRSEFTDEEREAASQILFSRGWWRGDLTQYHKDGGELYVQATVTLLKDNNGVPIGTVAVNHDDSERKQDAQALDAKIGDELEFQQYLRSLHGITIALTQTDDLDDFYRHAVEYALEQLGFERFALFLYDPFLNLAKGTYGTDSEGKLVDEHRLLFPPRPNSIMARAFERTERFCHEDPSDLYVGGDQLAGSGWNAAAVLWNGKEGLGWVVADNLLSGKPARKPQMEILSLYGLTLGTLLAHKQSIAALKDGESRLRVSQQMLRNVLETIPVRVFWKDQNLIYLGANRLYLQDVSLSGAEELIGKREHEMPWYSETVNYVEDERKILLTGNPLLNHEESMELPDGKVIWFQSNKVPLRDNSGAIIGVLAAYTDITERKHAEEALQQALDREKELSELKSRLVSMASHEFRTPLSTILSSAEILNRYGEKLDAEQTSAKLNLIAERVNHLAQIVEDVLNLGRIDSGHIEFHPSEVDLDALCREVITEFQTRPDMRHEIHYMPPLIPRLSWLDKMLMRQVITNLISNAIKYSPQGKMIWVTLDSESLCVRDEGIGIPQADMNHLFEPFHRAHNVGVIPGTGLGLAIAKEAVERHGGRITVESTVDAGTTFCVRLPPEDGSG